MQEYVVAYARPIDKQNQVLLILKDRPERQKNRLNLPGGKIELGETPEEAAARELFEETGIKPYQKPKILGRIVGTWGMVYCADIPIRWQEPAPRPEETEKPMWLFWNDLLQDRRLMPNLLIIIPIMHAYLKDWVVHDQGVAANLETISHTVGVTLNIGERFE